MKVWRAALPRRIGGTARREPGHEPAMCIEGRVPSKLKAVIPHLCSPEPAGEGGAASQAMSRTEPLGDAEGVSAGRTSPSPLLIPTQKPGSHRRGPPRAKNKATGHQKSHEPSENMRQMLKEMQQAGEDEVAGKASPSAWMNKVLKPLEPPADVSTGRTSPASPAPTLDAIRKPSCHGRGKVQDTTDKISLQPSQQIRQELKEPLQTRQEIDIVLQWKVAILEGSTPSSLPAPAAGKKAKPDMGTGTADWEAGKDSPLAWRSEVVKPSGHSAGVSAGTTSPTPTLDATEKPSSLGRGPPIGETKDLADKKFQNPFEIMWQRLKEMLQGGQEMKAEPVQMKAFPRGSSGSMPASAAEREAMPGTGTGDKVVGKASPSAWMNKVLKPLEPHADVSTGRTSPAPTLDAAQKPSCHGRGPPKGETKDLADKKFQNPFEIMWQRLKEMLQGGQVMDQKAVQKEEHPGRSSGSLAAPAAGRKAMPDTGTGTLSSPA
ncbi:uncharacterized protein LOC135308342 [Passer domesticus]|uniref:uncharacterized protein LOC135308342 n=1 Tax=Passer domesticus TaxID=48849 RepID=UPI0030FE3661